MTKEESLIKETQIDNSVKEKCITSEFNDIYPRK